MQRHSVLSALASALLLSGCPAQEAGPDVLVVQATALPAAITELRVVTLVNGKRRFASDTKVPVKLEPSARFGLRVPGMEKGKLSVLVEAMRVDRYVAVGRGEIDYQGGVATLDVPLTSLTRPKEPRGAFHSEELSGEQWIFGIHGEDDGVEVYAAGRDALWRFDGLSFHKERPKQGSEESYAAVWKAGDVLLAVQGNPSMAANPGTGRVFRREASVWVDETLPETTPSLYGLWGDATESYAVGAKGIIWHRDSQGAWTKKKVPDVVMGTPMASLVLRAVWGTKDAIYVVGSNMGPCLGFVLRKARTAPPEAAFEVVHTSTRYRLFALWGDPQGRIYGAGGAFSRDGSPGCAIVRQNGEQFEDIVAPAQTDMGQGRRPLDAVCYSIHGQRADDLWLGADDAEVYNVDADKDRGVIKGAVNQPPGIHYALWTNKQGEIWLGGSGSGIGESPLWRRR